MRADEPGRFQELQSRMHVSNAAAIETHRHNAPAALFLFDILLDGKKALVDESLRVRRQRLAALMSLASDHALRLSDESNDGRSMLEEARRGWESHGEPTRHIAWSADATGSSSSSIAGKNSSWAGGPSRATHASISARCYSAL